MNLKPLSGAFKKLLAAILKAVGFLIGLAIVLTIVSPVATLLSYLLYCEYKYFWDLIS